MEYEHEIETHPIPHKNPREWLRKLKSCDQSTWDELVKYYAEDLRSDILASLRKRNLNDDWLDDIEQETWITAIRQIDDFVWQSQDKFYHWLRSIALNHLRRYKRAEAKYGFDLNESDDEEDALEQFAETWRNREASVEDTVIVLEMYSALDFAMRKLNPRTLELLLQWLAGKKPKELAAIYGMKVATVSQILSRAKEELRQHINLDF